MNSYFFLKKKKNKLRAKEQFSTRENNSQFCRYYQTGRYDPTAFAIQVREETDPVPNHGGACFMADLDFERAGLTSNDYLKVL